MLEIQIRKKNDRINHLRFNKSWFIATDNNKLKLRKSNFKKTGEKTCLIG